MAEAERYYHGTGRRKSAVARVRLYAGTGSHTVNELPLEQVFTRPAHRTRVMQALAATGEDAKYHLQVKVSGGGIAGWADAIANGAARALLAADPAHHKTLRRSGLLTRDARVKERKKYGLKRARKAPQYTKR